MIDERILTDEQLHLFEEQEEGTNGLEGPDRSASWLLLFGILTSMIYILLDPFEGTERERIARVRNIMRALCRR